MINVAKRGDKLLCDFGNIPNDVVRVVNDLITYHLGEMIEVSHSLTRSFEFEL